jgi:hypothetical protein
VTVPAGGYGLAALAGTSPNVGVIGYTLGGGMGWLARRYGLAANSVTAVEVVTGDAAKIRKELDAHLRQHQYSRACERGTLDPELEAWLPSRPTLRRPHVPDTTVGWRLFARARRRYRPWVAGVSPGPPAISACLQASQSGCSVACNVRNRKLINTRYARILHPRRDPGACVLRESAGPRCPLRSSEALRPWSTVLSRCRCAGSVRIWAPTACLG